MSLLSQAAHVIRAVALAVELVSEWANNMAAEDSLESLSRFVALALDLCFHFWS